MAFTLLVFCFAYSDTLKRLSHHWLAFDGNQSHGIAVLLLATYLILRLLKASHSASSSPSWFGILALLLCSIIWYLSAIANIDIIQQLTLLPIVYFVFFAIFGRKYAQSFLPYIGLLVFVIPIWDYLVPGLVNISSMVVEEMVEASNIPALIVGNSFFLSDGQVDIVGGCSGVKYLTISLVICYYILLTSKTSLSQKLQLTGLAIGLSLLINWVRIFLIILIAHFSKMESSLVHNHDTFGWFLYFLVVIPLILISKLYPAKSIEERAISTSDHSTPDSWPILLIYLLAACLAVAAGPLIIHFSKFSGSPAVESTYLSTIPKLNVVGVSADTIFSFNSSKSIKSYRVIYNNSNMHIDRIENWKTSKDEKLIPYIASLYNQNIWTNVQSDEFHLSNNTKAQFLLLERKPYGELHIVAFWFNIGPYTTTSYSAAKLLQVPAIILGHNSFQSNAVRMKCMDRDCAFEKQQVIALASELAKPISSDARHR